MSHWTKDDEIRSGMMQSASNRTEQLAARVAQLEQRVHALEQMLQPIRVHKVLGETDAH